MEHWYFPHTQTHNDRERKRVNHPSKRKINASKIECEWKSVCDYFSSFLLKYRIFIFGVVRIALIIRAHHRHNMPTDNHKHRKKAERGKEKKKKIEEKEKKRKRKTQTNETSVGMYKQWRMRCELKRRRVTCGLMSIWILRERPWKCVFPGFQSLPSRCSTYFSDWKCSHFQWRLWLSHF